MTAYADERPLAAGATCRGMATCRRASRSGIAQLLAALWLCAASATAADVVRVEDRGNGRYTLTTTLSDTTDPMHGQLAIVPKAEELCGERHPHYGHYRFETNAPPLAITASGPTSLRYTQDVECRDTPQEAVRMTSAPVPPALSTPPSDTDAALIRSNTLAYLRAKDAADANAAYALLSEEMASYATPEAWAEARSAFKAEAGPGAEPSVVRITWYDNPQDAPTPGRYAAADYRVDYPSGAFTCGFVAWLRQADGGYLIVRDEEGQATPTVVADLTPEQRSMMRAQLQCRD